MKKFLAILLALIMVAALVGCGKKKRQPITLTLSTEDSEAILNAAGIRLPPVEEAQVLAPPVLTISQSGEL